LQTPFRLGVRNIQGERFSGEPTAFLGEFAAKSYLWGEPVQSFCKKGFAKRNKKALWERME
jgi:hypothetical protein